MKNPVTALKKVLALLIFLTFMTKATTIVTYNGQNNTQNEYFEFTEKETDDTHFITKVSVQNRNFMTQDVVLQIPGSINDKKVKLWSHSFERFGMIKNDESATKFEATNLKVSLRFLQTNNVCCQMPEDCENLFEQAVALSDVDFRNIDNNATVTTMCGMLKACTNLKNIDFGDLDTSNVGDMRELFRGCSNLLSINFRNFNTSNVTSMAHMFRDCSSMQNLDLSNFNVMNVIDMSYMFCNMHQVCNLNLLHFDTINVECMHNMFEQCGSLAILDLSSFNFLNVYSISMMFKDCYNLTYIRFGTNRPQSIVNTFLRTCNLLSFK